MKSPKLVKPWENGDPRPWVYTSWREWYVRREGWRFWIVRTRPATDAEFRQVIREYALRPPQRYNCRCVIKPV